MRLTDILRDKKRSGTSSTRLDGSAGNHYQDDSLSHNRRHADDRGGDVSGFLSAGDLSTVYDLDSPPPSRDIEPVRRKTDPGPQPDNTQSTASDQRTAPAGVHGAGADRGHGAPEAPPPEEVDLSEIDRMEDTERADALHIETLSILDELYQQAEAGEIIDIKRLITPLARIIDELRESNALLRKAIRLKRGGRSFTAHSLNVAILAIKIGYKRNYQDERLFSLGLSAIMGDIGMTRVDSAILNNAGKLTPEEMSEIRRHVEYATDILSEVGDIFPFLPPIVYQHHERTNGSGYPRGLKGQNIHEFAKINGMCDMYIALTEPKVNREKFSGYVALQQIIARRGIDFDPKIIKSLIDVLSVFPLESLVRLNNGTIGRVVDISEIHPTRPKLQILINSDGDRLTSTRILDLEKEPLLYVEDPDIEEGVVS